MFDENIGLEFPVTVYGNLEKYNDTISKGRCRVFYKYGNRNGTYITDEFADSLLSTISYAPIKGIYEGEEGDYTDHGTARSQGRIYGIVPENPNITWEEHEDEDGTIRTYACVDVLIFTGLYAEANAIIGKSQSMEIYPPSIKGAWKIIEGKKYYVFESGHFLGLQILGDSTEPCFEGAAFFALYQDLKKIVEQIEKYDLNVHNGGNVKMLNYKLSDNAKFNALWSLLNVNYCEAGNWTIEYDICEIYDEYAVVRNYSEGCFERVYYTKNDETDSVELGDRVRCFIVDVSEAEKKALDALHAMNEGTYEKVDENFQASKTAAETAAADLATKIEECNALSNTIETLTTEKSNFETKIEEQEEYISTLTTERNGAQAQLYDANITINSLTEQNTSLVSFKAKVEKQQKQTVIEKYADLLGEEVINAYIENIDNYSIKDLDKELAYELVRSNQSVFSNKGQSTGFIPKEEVVVSGLEEILSKYKKN